MYQARILVKNENYFFLRTVIINNRKEQQYDGVGLD